MRPPEQVKKELARKWIHKAQVDMDAPEVLLSDERASLYPSCFHAQQTVEKFLKAYLTWHQVEFPKTHALGELLDLMIQVDETLATRLSDVTLLNPYGVEIRYPGDIPEPTATQAEEAIAMARSVRDDILAALKIIL